MYLTVIKLLFQEIFISIISVYDTHCGLDDSQKDNFYDNVINVIRKLGRNCRRRAQWSCWKKYGRL